MELVIVKNNFRKTIKLNPYFLVSIAYNSLGYWKDSVLLNECSKVLKVKVRSWMVITNHGQMRLKNASKLP